MEMSTESFTDLESALRDFEPLFWVGPRTESLDRLYEPDGTLYAICLDGPCEISTDRRKVHVHQGDLVILPPAIAIEVAPSARWFGIVYTGPYPYHFRERFIQVWGFEHHSYENAIDQPLLHDPRHRIHIWRGSPKIQHSPDSFQFRMNLANLLQNDCNLITQYAGPGQNLDNEDSCNSILFEIPNEALYLINREAKPQPVVEQTMSPEYKPSQSS